MCIPPVCPAGTNTTIYPTVNPQRLPAYTQPNGYALMRGSVPQCTFVNITGPLTSQYFNTYHNTTCYDTWTFGIYYTGPHTVTTYCGNNESYLFNYSVILNPAQGTEPTNTMWTELDTYFGQSSVISWLYVPCPNFTASQFSGTWMSDAGVCTTWGSSTLPNLGTITSVTAVATPPMWPPPTLRPGMSPIDAVPFTSACILIFAQNLPAGSMLLPFKYVCNSQVYLGSIFLGLNPSGTGATPLLGYPGAQGMAMYTQMYTTQGNSDASFVNTIFKNPTYTPQSNISGLPLSQQTPAQVNASSILFNVSPTLMIYGTNWFAVLLLGLVLVLSPFF